MVLLKNRTEAQRELGRINVSGAVNDLVPVVIFRKDAMDGEVYPDCSFFKSWIKAYIYIVKQIELLRELNVAFAAYLGEDLVERRYSLWDSKRFSIRKDSRLYV